MERPPWRDRAVQNGGRERGKPFHLLPLDAYPLLHQGAGAGRETKESEIDYTAGIILHKKTGEKVEKGDVLAALYTSKEELFEAAAEKYKKSIFIEEEAPKKEPLVYARVTPKGIEKY